ncbi:MAG: hypothetical protein ACREJ1_12390, partial [Candidatus Methylomirabilales bacterium]
FIHCTEREHGGTQAVSRHSGSPREARSEGPKVLWRQNQHPVEFSANEGCPLEWVSLGVERGGIFAGRSPPLVE